MFRITILVFAFGLGWCSDCAGSDEVRHVLFTNAAESAELQFTHVSPYTEERHTHLAMGSGLGWIDYDLDSWPDLFLVQGAEWKGATTQFTVADSLMRNRRGRFADRTAASQVAGYEYGMGVAVGDANNDGFPDLYVANLGRDQLYINNGDGTFTRISDWPTHEAYSASVTWVDVDNDSLLDVYQVNYLDVDLSDYEICVDQASGLHIICPPWKFPGKADALLINDGAGQFHDESQQRGLTSALVAQGLGVVCSDIDKDGDSDIYVANDSVPNHVWVNDGTGHFRESGFLSGTALNLAGQREAGMGVACRDVDGNGFPDLFVTNFHGETNTFYRNEGASFFLDITNQIGLGAPSRSRLGFGTLFLDADNDSQIELFVANGHIHDRLKELGRDVPYRQKSQLFSWNGSRFDDVSDVAGDWFQIPNLGRGCASGDYDGDGQLDIAVTTLNGPAALLRNESSDAGNSIRLCLVGTECNRDAIGARIEIRVGDDVFTVERQGSSSYLSCDDRVVHMGIGQNHSANVTVYWPGCDAETWTDVAAGRLARLIQGRKQPVYDGRTEGLAQ